MKQMGAKRTRKETAEKKKKERMDVERKAEQSGVCRKATTRHIPACSMALRLNN